MMLPGYGGFGSPQAIRLEEERAYSRAESDRDDPHLRSCRAVMKYHIHASDGDIGHVEGLVVDDETWAIRYIVVDTSNWWLGHKVLVAPQWIEAVNWAESTVSVKMTRQGIKDAPAYFTDAPLERRDEAGLYDHYGQPGYWSDDVVLETEISRV